MRQLGTGAVQFVTLLSGPGVTGANNAANAAETGGMDFGFSCCVVMTIATDPMIKAAAKIVREARCSPAKSAPSITATTGLT